MKNLHLDIETGDPDDLWTLALMGTHPKVRLRTVSVYPGKAMHDILAALLHINPDHGTWVTGHPVREQGNWGFEEGNSIIKALVSVDKEGVLNELY